MTRRAHPAGLAQALLLLLLTVLVACGGPDIPEPEELPDTEPGILDAVREAQAAVRDDPDNPEPWGRLGDRYRAHAWAEAALACYGKAGELDPEGFTWPYLIADLYSLQDPETAVGWFEKALALDASYAPSHIRYGIVLSTLGRADEAREHFEEAIRLDGGIAHSYLGLGQLELAAGRFEEAAEKLRRAISLYPSLGEAYSGLAQALLAMGDKEAAEEHAALGRRLPKYTSIPDPRQARPVAIAGSKDFNTRGEQLHQMGDREQALEHFQEALRNNPDHILARKNVGLVLMEMGKHAEAEPHLRAALDLDPGLPKAQMALGIVLAGRGETEAAEEHLRHAVFLAPRAAEVHYNLGTFLGTTGRVEEALELLDQTLSLEPGHMAARVNRAMALQSLGRHDEAMSALEEALEQTPGDARLTQLLGEMKAARRRAESG